MMLLPYLACASVLPRQAFAGFKSTASNNIAIYWGQNSYGRDTSQQHLSYYCENSDIDIIPLAFMSAITTPTTVNFANAGDNCTLFPGTTLFSCPEIEKDIQACQNLGKTIVLSIGGATYTEGGFGSSSEAVSWANTLWAMFGPMQANSSIQRPFGSAVVDGFDFDFESATSNMAPFAAQLRANMDAATRADGKTYYLSAAPQCPYPDAADNDMLNGAISFDYIMVQFYNNYCGVSSYVDGEQAQSSFNLATWDDWAHSVSKNPDVKILLGVPGNTGGGAGYVSGMQLSSVISFSKQYSSFGGVMVWDMSQVYENPGFLSAVASDLRSNPSLNASSTITSINSTRSQLTKTSTVSITLVSSTGTPAARINGLVSQWGQCAGTTYTGPTQCESPYQCIKSSPWWSQCE